MAGLATLFLYINYRPHQRHDKANHPDKLIGVAIHPLEEFIDRKVIHAVFLRLRTGVKSDARTVHHQPSAEPRIVVIHSAMPTDRLYNKIVRTPHEKVLICLIEQLIYFADRRHCSLFLHAFVHGRIALVNGNKIAYCTTLNQTCLGVGLRGEFLVLV